MINGITASLAQAARKIVEDSRAKAAEESAKNISKLQEKMMKPAHSGTAPRNDQERKLAAMTPPADKITHGDVLKGRGVKKEEAEQTDEAMSHQAATTMKHIKPGTLRQNYGDRQDAANIKPGIKGVADRLAMLDRAKKEGRLKEEIVNEAPIDGVAPGSMEGDKHMCATKVFHKEWKEGKPLFSQHADPDAEGNIAWYDVMFEHGIEKEVAITELQVLAQESHMHSKKKKM